MEKRSLQGGERGRGDLPRSRFPTQQLIHEVVGERRFGAPRVIRTNDWMKF
jgi:hypothetical protein